MLHGSGTYDTVPVGRTLAGEVMGDGSIEVTMPHSNPGRSEPTYPSAKRSKVSGRSAKPNRQVATNGMSE